MTAVRSSKSRIVAVFAIFAAIAGAWILTAWLGRDPRPAAIAWTGVAFVVCLGATYFGLWSAAIAWARDKRLMTFRAIATTAVLLIVVLILEVGAFAGFVNYDLVYRQLRGFRGGPAVQFVEDVDFGYRRAPNMNWTGKVLGDLAQNWNLPAPSRRENTFTTDSRGFRHQREIQSADIVLIGDSYVEGFYVSDHETAAVALEGLTGHSVANLGQSGYGSLQELMMLQRFGLPLKPKMVAWFYFEGNDLYDDEEFEGMSMYIKEHGTFETPAPIRRTWESRWDAFVKTSFTRNTYRQIRRSAHALVPSGVASFGWYEDENGEAHRLYYYDYATLTIGDYERLRFESTKETLRTAQRACEESGARFVVFYIPMKFRVYGEFSTFPPHSPCREWQPWELNSLMAEFCREAGIEFVDMSAPMISAAAAGRLLYAPEDSHWNEEGHQFVAEQVAKVWNDAAESPEVFDPKQP